MAKGNRNPKPKDSAFHQTKRVAISDRSLGELAKKPVSVKLEVDVDEYIRGLPQKDRVTFLRESITNAARAEMANQHSEEM
ncbi:hypothetical protein [Okeania sp. SIO2B3]|uniref:hypothetical protein n=1 Tax=Okeania sp. SIO2B3 TaxID=2607784 RepID=UPI0013C058D4|nr:hypothetical protein [Okeania sp. SIO2B3]NET45918.1 hypothetical protein [Okeania sp. SIO2B3]